MPSLVESVLGLQIRLLVVWQNVNTWVKGVWEFFVLFSKLF